MNNACKIPFMQKALNSILFRRYRAAKYNSAFLKCIEGGLTNEFLNILLRLMSLTLFIDSDYRKNIIGFNAKYVFTDKEGAIYVVADFGKNRLAVRKGHISDPVLTLMFKDGEALMKLLMSDSPDVLNALLNQEVDFTGNANYLYKFAYMAMRLKLSVLGEISV